MSTVTISTLEELKAFRDAVNNGNSCKGQTVELSADIDLKGEEWTPIGKSGSTFQGVFNGNGHTVSNLVINQPGMSDVGFFGVTTNGEIKNLTIHNADVKGRLDVGAVAGTPYTSKYTNIKLTGDVKVEGYAYVGGMFGKNAYANLTGLTIDANSGSYVKAESGIYRSYVGGVIGFMGEGNQTVQDVTSNLNVIGSTCDVGGIAGIAHYGNKFINVTCTAENITLKNAQDAGDEQEIGGIAGVWNNSDSKTVLMINCSAENTTLKSALLGEDKSEEVKGNTVTGKSYSGETATSGTLLVGKETQTENGTALTFTVSGPKAAEDLEKAFGPLQANEDGTFTAQTTYLVRIGGAYYDTLDAALAAAKNGDTLTLLGNITLDSMLTVGKDITIDGAGQYSITASENDAWKGQQMIQVSKANVTFKDLTLDGAGQSLTLIQAAAATGLTLDGVTMQNARNGIYKGSTFDNGGVTISNSTINVKVYAFNASGKLAFVNVSGSTLYGWTSYASSLTDASGSFKDTKFFEADDRGLNGIVAALRPYFPTVVDNCQFSEAFSMTTGDYYNENGLSIGKSNVVMNLDNVSVIKADGSASDVPLADLVSGKFAGSGGSAVSDVAFVVDGVKDEASGKYSGGTFIGDSAVIASTLAEGLAPKANEDGTYSAATPDMTNILVNSGWTSMKPGEVIPGQDGFNFGFNAFDSMDGILAKYATDATANTATSKIILNSDAENNSATTGKVYLYTNSDLAFAADGTPRTATFHGSRLYLMNVYQLDGEHKPVKNEFIPTITIEEGVSLVTDKMLMVGQNVDQDDIDTDGNPTRDPAAVNLVVNGMLTTELYVASLSSVTVNKTGKVLVGYKEAFITRSSSTVTVNGTGSKDDVQFAVNYTSMQGGVLNLNDTSMTTGMFWIGTASQGFVIEGSTINAKNSKIAGSQDGSLSDKSSIVLSDGSEITMAGKLENNGSIQIKGSTLSVSSLTNNGAINVSGSSTVNIGTTSGNGAFNLNGANLTDSRIGNAEVYGDVTANNLEAGNISVGFGRYTAANASLDLSGSVKANIIYVGVKTVEGDAPYANFSYALNIHDAQGDIGTVNARTTGTLTISSSELNIGDLLIRNQTEIIDSNITGKFGSGGTGHWAIYEDDDSSRTASLTVTGSTLNTNYICIGKNINGQYEADSNAKLTLTDSTFIADSYIYLMKNTAGFTTGITMQNFSVLQAKTIYNGSEIRMNHNSTIKFSGEYISDGGSIVVDMTGAKAGGFFKLIDYTGADPASVNYQNVTLLNGNGYTAVTMNGDLYASNADMSVIQVNSAWAGNAPGTEVAEGYYFGFNAFDKLSGAADGMTADTATIKLTGDVEESTDAAAGAATNRNFNFRATQDLVLTADAAATIKLTVDDSLKTHGGSTNSTGELAFLSDSDDRRATITIDKNVTINTNAKVWFGRTAVTKEVHATDVIINGTINQQKNTDTNSYGIMQIQSDKGSTVTLNGTIYLDWSLLVKGSSFTVTGTGLLGRSAGSWHDTYVSVEKREDLGGKFILDGGKTANLSALAVNELSSAELKNGANADFSQSATISSGASLTISNSNLTTETLTNNGAITMDSGSFLAFGSYAGTSAITIDTAGYDKTKIAKLIDYTGTGSVDYGTIIGNYDSDLFTVLDNDLFIGKADMNVIQVNSVWAGNAPGTEVAAGYYFGFNAFDNANDAINAAGANATVRIQGTGENTTPITRKSYMENLTVETPEGGSSHLCMHAGSTTYVYGEEAENGDAVRHEATVEYKNQDISFAGHSHFESLAGMTVKFTGSKVGHDGGTPFFKVYGDSNVVFDNSTYNAKNGSLWFYVSGQLDLQKNSLLNIETGSGFRILAAGGKVNVDESGLTVSNTNITIGSYYIYGDSDKTAKAIVGGKKQGHDANSGNDYSATLNITNGRLVNKNGFVRVGASYILDDAATDEREGLTIKANPDKPADYADLAKAYLNITGSSAADLNELYVDGNGIVTVQDSSKLTAKAVTVDGKLTISHGSAMTVSGVLSVSGDSNAGRGITVDGTGFTSGTKAVISAGSIVWNKNILASGLETGMTLAVTNNAVYLTDQNQDTVHVGGKNADGVPEANTTGAGIAGWNAFDTILDAVNAIGMTPDKTVFDFGNAAKTYTGTLQNETDKVEFTQVGKYTFTGGELAHLPYLHGNAADAELVFDKAKLTLSKVKTEKGSSLTVMDSQLDFHPHSGDLAFLSLYNDGIMNVAGSVVGISDEMNDTDMPKAGKAGNSDTNGVYLAKDGMSRGALTIQGQVNMTDSTLFASYRSRVLAGTRGQGEMNLKNSVMYADGLQILQATEDTGKATVNLDASALIQSHYSSSASLYSLVIGNDEAANAAAVISLTNGSLLDWSKAATTRMPYEPWPDSDSVVINTNGTLEIKGNSTAKTGNITNGGVIVIDNGKLEAAAVANNGTFSVSGTVDLSGSFTGNVFNFAAGSVLTSSKGFTFDGDHVTDGLSAIGAGEFSFGKLRFNVDKANPKSVDVKIGKNAVVKVSNVMEIDRRTAKDPDAVDENIAGILTLEDGAKVTVGTETAKGWFYNKFEASTNISKGAELNVYGEFQNKGYFTVNGTLNLYSVSGLGMTAAGREDKGGIMNIDGGVVNYSDTEASKGWFGIGTKRQNNPTWDDATDTKTSELNITNGGQLNINLLEGNPYDTAFGIGQYGKLSVTGEGAAVNAASAGLQNNGEILLQDKANMTLGKLISNGTITVSNSTLTVSGDLTLNGSFSFDLASTITVGNLTNSGTITIDMNNVEAGQMFKLIDHTGTGTGSSYGDVTLINNAGSYRTIVIDNDLYALNVDMSVLKVNAAWAGTAAGTKVAEGYYLGINAFDALSATTGNIAKDGSDTTIEIGSDLTASGELEFDHGSGKVIFTAGSEGEKVINTGDVVFENKVNANIVVGKDVTFNIADNNNDFAVYYGNNLDLYGTIKGGQNYGSLYLYQGDHTIHAEGTLATGRLHSRYDSVTVLGAEGETRRYAEDVAVADRTDAQVNINFLFQESGTFAAKDTFVNVGAANGGDGHGIYDSNKGSVRDTNAPVFNFANTKLNAYQIQLQRGETTFGADGSVITITAEFNTNGTVNLTNTKLTVGKTLTNTGSFSFDLASTVTVGNLTNNGTITIDMTGASSDLALLIDYTGNGVMTLADYGSVTLSDANYSTMVINNDLYAISTSLDLKDVAVNAAWAGTEIGKEVAEGKYFGLNAFDTTDNLSGLPAMKTLSITDTTAGGALDLTKFGSLAMTAVNSTLTDLALANSSSLNMDGSSTAGDISAAGSLTIAGDAAVNTVKTAAADAELNINGLTVNQGISGFTTISTGGVSVKKGGITLTAGNDVMNVNGMLISMADGIDFLDGSNSLTLSSAASVVAYGIYATNGSLDLTLTLADNVGKAIITVADDGIFADAASTITLDVSKLQVGSYILVNNLSSFSKRIQVNGDTLGIGESLNINGMRYTLNYSNKTLSLDVTDFIVDNDIDNNGYADILMFNQKKEAALWLMKSNGTAEWKELFPFAGGDIADGWTLFDTGDTTGNNYSDVILYNEQDKDVGVWQMSDGETTWRTLERLDSDHELVAVRDFNGNGKRDILSRGTDGSLQFHYTDSGKTERFELSNDWKIVGAGDISGDGKADVIFQNGTKTGAWLTGAENEMPQWRDLYDLGTADNSILGTGDFDGNGIADVLIATKNSNGTVSYGTWLMNDQTEAQWRTLVTLPASVVIESISDINGDGKAELRVRNGNDIASISMSVSLDSNTVLTQWNSHGPVTDEWTTKLASPIL